MPVSGRNATYFDASGLDFPGAGMGILSDAEKEQLSPSLRLLLEVVSATNWYQFAWRTGLIVNPKNKKLTLPLPIVLKVVRKQPAMTMLEVTAFAAQLDMLGIKVVAGWFQELFDNPALDRLPARLLVDATNPSLMPDGEALESRLSKILGTGVIVEIALASQHLPLLQTSIGDIGMPANATYKGKKLTGKGIVVGIIDDGFPFAHQDFLTNIGTATAPIYRARTVRLWDQTTALTPSGAARGWKMGAYGYGRQITSADIDTAINAPTSPVRPHIAPQGWVEEELVYEYLEYPMGRAGKVTTHGARVAGIAAGNGRAAMAYPGVAPEADVVFVQLPPTMIDVNAGALTNTILDGIKYVFNYAQANGQAAVVNISFGSYAHAHDGSSPWEIAMDQLLMLPDRSIVVSAGNGFEADCHVRGTVGKFKTVTQDWWVKPHDPTPNDVEIWYDASTKVNVSLVSPDGVVYGPFNIGTTQQFPSVGPAIGLVDHRVHGNGDCCALIWMFETGRPLPNLPPPPVPGTGPAPAGVWKIRIANTGNINLRYHAWIQRDDVGAPGGRRRQSRFDPERTDPRNTICDLATGNLTISVGAYNVATQEIGGYSAAGPTRPTGGAGGRPKPDVVAPSEEVPTGRGVLATSSARAQPTRISGTSASAPHVAGIVALILEYAKFKGVSLTAAQIRAAIRASGRTPGLLPNRHQRAARYPKVKQAAVWNNVTGTGKVSLRRALRFLFP